MSLMPWNLSLLLTYVQICVPFRVLSETNSRLLFLAAPSKSQSLNSLPTLEISCLSFSDPHPLFSIACRLFLQNTGGWHTLVGISRFPRTTIPCRQFTRIPLSATLRTLFYLLENEHLQKCIKTKDFNFLRMNTCEKTRGRGVIVNQTCLQTRRPLCLCGKKNFVGSEAALTQASAPRAERKSSYNKGGGRAG